MSGALPARADKEQSTARRAGAGVGAAARADRARAARAQIVLTHSGIWSSTVNSDELLESKAYPLRAPAPSSCLSPQPPSSPLFLFTTVLSFTAPPPFSSLSLEWSH
jgi:hypothetical protein